MSEIRSRPSNDDYREGWERIFGAELAEGLERGRERFLERQQLRADFGLPHLTDAPFVQILNPNDAQEHPPAD